MEAYRVVIRRGSHIFLKTIGSQTEVRLSPLLAFYPQGRFLIFISVRGRVNLRNRVRLEELGKFKNKIHPHQDSNTRPSSGINIHTYYVNFTSKTKVPSIATVFFWMFLLLFHTHYMFRPLRAIFKWNIYLSILRSYFCYTGSVVPSKLAILYTYISFCFGDFSPLSVCMWWIRLLQP
jgi:hypothetical protein